MNNDTNSIILEKSTDSGKSADKGIYIFFAFN